MSRSTKKPWIFPVEPEYSHIKSAIHDVKALLNSAGVSLNSDFSVEFSHHHGISEFRKIGAVLIDCGEQGLL